MALMAGTIVTWLQNTEKLARPSADARSIVIAVDGAVVSNPMAMNTTCRSGFCRAIFSESSGEYTIRMSVPAALASKNDPCEPGTRIMSPNEVMITSGSRRQVPWRRRRAPSGSRTPGSRDRAPG